MKRVFIILSIFIVCLVGIVILLSSYFFKVAEVSTDYTKVVENNSKPPIRTTNFKRNSEFLNSKGEDWYVNTDDNLRLYGRFIPSKIKNKKTVILIHGYGSNHNSMSDYAMMFYKMGYNILSPDNRSFGKSEGKYIGYGFLDATDYLLWIQKLILNLGEDSEILVMGESMGAATTMMLSGMNPPPQVKCYIEDSGYASVKKELKYQAAKVFKIPMEISAHIIDIVSLYSKILANYSYSQADASKLLEDNTRPMLFIHGTGDKTVPIESLDIVYNSTRGYKKKYIVPDAQHVQSYAKDPQRYENEVKHFLQQCF